MPIGRRCLAEGSKIMVRDQPNSAASLVKADRPALRLPVSLDIVRRDMSISRRHFLAALGSLSVAACDTAIPLVSVARTQAAPPDMRPVPNAAFSAWVTAFRSRASSAGISAQTLNTAFADAGYIPGVINRDRNQIQKRRTLEEYLSITVSDERLAKGRAAFSRHGRTLRAIEAKYGVDALIVTAIWGIESQYGEKTRNDPGHIVNGDAGLRRSARVVLRKPAAGRIADPSARRHLRAPTRRQLGRCHGAHPVHSDILPVLRRRFHRRRPPRHLGQRSFGRTWPRPRAIWPGTAGARVGGGAPRPEPAGRRAVRSNHKVAASASP